MTAAFQRQLLSGDRAEPANAPRIFAERIWQTWTTKLCVPVALDKPADKMPVLICVTACGMNRAFAVAFSLS